MIPFADILAPDRVLYGVNLSTKKKVLELISETIENSIPALRAHDIFDGFITREKLGCTAFGHGIAIPHTRLDNAIHPIGCFILLKQRIDFSAQDHMPVEMLFALIVPAQANERHLALLANIAQYLQQDNNRQKLRLAKSHAELYQILCQG